MMQKQAVLQSLQESLDTEEAAIPIYTKHLQNVMFLSGLNEKEFDQIQKTLFHLRKDSEHHADIFRTLIQEVEKSPKDVY